MYNFHFSQCAAGRQNRRGWRGTRFPLRREKGWKWLWRADEHRRRTFGDWGEESGGKRWSHRDVQGTAGRQRQCCRLRVCSSKSSISDLPKVWYNNLSGAENATQKFLRPVLTRDSEAHAKTFTNMTQDASKASKKSRHSWLFLSLHFYLFCVTSI